MTWFPNDLAEERLSALESRARVKAEELRRPVLASWSLPMQAVDPLAVLEIMRAELRSGDEKGISAEPMMYWGRASDAFELAGFGAAATFTGHGEDRFLSVENDWNELLAHAVFDDKTGNPPLAGPTLMGGFAFDADGPHSDRWKEFPPALLFLPRVQIAVDGSRCWITINLVVDAHESDTADRSSLLRAARAASPQHKRWVPSTEPIAEVTILYADILPQSRWLALVDRAIDSIREGAFEKVVVAREVRASASGTIDVRDTLRRLRTSHADCCVFGLWLGESVFVGASPERLVRLEGNEVRASGLAGSVRRGGTPVEDSVLAAQLRNSAKDRAEHEIVGRALTSALGTLCTDVEAEAEPSILSLPNIHHLHTAVRARLRPGNSLLKLVARLHPTPAVGGEPRDAALAFLKKEEQLDRGWYAGPIGWVQRDRGEFAVALRSALIQGSEASLYAGCGIVADSDSADEYAESRLKLRPMQLALQEPADGGTGHDNGRASAAPSTSIIR